jgi:hypothetical protein
MNQETTKRTRHSNVPVEDFAKLVRQAADLNEGPNWISEQTGLKLNSVHTRLNLLRKEVGKENVPVFNKKRSRIEKDKLIEILNPAK